MQIAVIQVQPSGKGKKTYCGNIPAKILGRLLWGLAFQLNFADGVTVQGEKRKVRRLDAEPVVCLGYRKDRSSWDWGEQLMYHSDNSAVKSVSGRAGEGALRMEREARGVVCLQNGGSVESGE